MFIRTAGILCDLVGTGCAEMICATRKSDLRVCIISQFAGDEIHIGNEFRAVSTPFIALYAEQMMRT